MKASVWFEAQGRSMKSRGINWFDAKRLIGIYSLPAFAKKAFARGHLLQGSYDWTDEARAKGHGVKVRRSRACPAGVALSRESQESSDGRSIGGGDREQLAAHGAVGDSAVLGRADSRAADLGGDVPLGQLAEPSPCAEVAQKVTLTPTGDGEGQQ